MDNSLFTSNHQLNYDEVVRRLRYWNDPALSSSLARRTGAIGMLISMLARERKNLYFEEKTT